VLRWGSGYEAYVLDPLDWMSSSRENCNSETCCSGSEIVVVARSDLADVVAPPSGVGVASSWHNST
jgi:hypothetical protein